MDLPFGKPFSPLELFSTTLVVSFIGEKCEKIQDSSLFSHFSLRVSVPDVALNKGGHLKERDYE